MAFFNLTMMGPQEPIKSVVRDSVPPQPTSTAGPFHNLRLSTPISSVRPDLSATPQSPVVVVQARNGKDRPTYPAVTQPIYQPPTIPPVMSPGRGVTAVFSVGDTPPQATTHRTAIHLHSTDPMPHLNSPSSRQTNSTLHYRQAQHSTSTSIP